MDCYSQMYYSHVETEEIKSDSYSVPHPKGFQEEINQQFNLQFNEVFNKFQTLFNSTAAFQDKQNILDELEKLHTKLSCSGVDTLKKIPIVGVSRGRPKKEKRDPIGVEWARLNLSQRMSDAKTAASSANNRKRGVSEVDDSQGSTKEAKKFKDCNMKTEGMIIQNIYGPFIK